MNAVTPLTKPARLGPKPRKPIARKSRPARVRRTASAAVLRTADLKWAKAVRESGHCAAIGRAMVLDDTSGLHHFRCSTPITAAHIVSRQYRATRTDPRNGLPLCLYIHSVFTSHPKAWESFVLATIGQKRYDELKALALGGVK